MKLLKHIIDINKIWISYFISKFMKINKKNRDIWLISERRDEAEDNGYHLFKYIREKHPSERVFYIIDKKSPAYMKIKKYGNIIQHNSLKHYIYYFLADKHISAFQFFGVPETPFLWKLEEMGIIKKQKVFLQHGITKEMLPFLKYENTKYRMFICGARPEYEYIKMNFGYPIENVKYLGFCRFDNLYNFTEKKQILVMPTWRQWLGMTNEDNKKEIDENNFIKSQYFNTYKSLLENKELQKVLEMNKYSLIFYPHPEMQRFINLFKSTNKFIKVANRKSYNLQELIKESELIITDYSSIGFDCAYMKKKLMYYQFDKLEYYKNHFQKGYFDCERNGFGPVIENEKELINSIKILINGGLIDNIYEKRAEDFFEIHDINNCKRTYEAIKLI